MINSYKKNRLKDRETKRFFSYPYFIRNPQRHYSVSDFEKFLYINDEFEVEYALDAKHASLDNTGEISEGLLAEFIKFKTDKKWNMIKNSNEKTGPDWSLFTTPTHKITPADTNNYSTPSTNEFKLKVHLVSPQELKNLHLGSNVWEYDYENNAPPPFSEYQEINLSPNELILEKKKPSTQKKTHKAKCMSIDKFKVDSIFEESTANTSRQNSFGDASFLTPVNFHSKIRTGHERAVSDIQIKLSGHDANSDVKKSYHQKSESESKALLTTIVENDLEDLELLAKQKVLNEIKKISTLELRNKGIYLAPSIQNTLNWFVTLRIPNGEYKGKKLKALIDIPISYPKHSPRVFFTTNVFHPLVDADSHEVDIEYLKVEKDVFSELPVFLMEIFLDSSYLEINESFNPDVSEYFTTEIDYFRQKIEEMDCDESLSLSDNNYQTNQNVNACIMKALHTSITLGSRLEKANLPKRYINGFIDRAVENISALFEQ